jgi:membrane protein YdbS with pleckstrin-like domain
LHATNETAGVSAKARAKKRQHDNWTRAVNNVRDAATEPVAPGAAGHGRKKAVRIHGWTGFKQACVELALVLPAGAFVVIWAVKIFSFSVYLLQIPLTYAIRRLDYEMRWYMVTDRSLRIRRGIWRVSEATMSFANIQQVSVSQGPLQRLLRLADVKVQSAGGGSGGHHDHHKADMHTGLFHCVPNAPEIRDLILDRLRRFREAGLGDPDEKLLTEPHTIGGNPRISPETLSAVRELAAEARALRAAITL